MTTLRCRKCTRRTLEGVEAVEDLQQGMVLATSLCKAQGGDGTHDWREMECAMGLICPRSSSEVAPSAGSAGVPNRFLPIAPTWTIKVEQIPDELLAMFQSKGSVHASSILNSSCENERAVILSWIQENIVSPVHFQLDHDHTVPPGAKNSFSDHEHNFVSLGYSVWDVDRDPTVVARLKFVQVNEPSRHFHLSGRPDYIISPSVDGTGAPITKADFLHTAMGIIEIQSKHRDEDLPLCEIQLQLYLVMLMNTLGLPAVVGFLVGDNGMCRTYRATRGGNILCEQNDLVHVSHIANVLHNLWEEGL